MRILSQNRVSYEARTYDSSRALSGTEVASVLHEDPSCVFKTLVTESSSRKYYVFVIPSDRELDLKKAASAVDEKSISMIPQKDLLPLTGYIHGGCSPVGMKKLFPTFLDISAESLPRICVSGGRLGLQIILEPEALRSVVPFRYSDLCRC